MLQEYLPTYKHSFIVNSNVDRVWNFYTDIKHLEIITPKKMDLKVIKSTSQKIIQGQEAWFSCKIILKRTWHSKITFLKQYEYVDEMNKGLFKKWIHSHKFEDISNGKQTEVIDKVNFELPYGLLGKLFESYAYDQLHKIFEHRKIMTIKELENV